VSRMSRKTRPIRAPFLIHHFALILGLVHRSFQEACTAFAPGKIILSGEHAVVYGCPALVTAVNLGVRVTVSRQQDSALRITSSQGSSTVASGSEWRTRCIDVQRRYAAFEQGSLPIAEVLIHPNQIIEMCRYEAEPVSGEEGPGLAIDVASELPIGRGMGSSAAVCTATLAALGAAGGREPDRATLFGQSLRVEKYLHGRPSGIDPYITVHGGCVRYTKGDDPVPLGGPPGPFWLVDSGRPEATTGESVSAVRASHGESDIWTQFERVTRAMQSALAGVDPGAVREPIRVNHRLLVEIGVVPPRVASFIAEVESRGGAAKVSGAGSVRGEGAGMVWISEDEAPADLCRTYDYSLVEVEGETDGVRIVHPG
jgi:mevalonate kinase